jgi:acyl-CoA thioester hydrolase
MSKVFEWPIRVYYEDTDAGGLVYHARYLHFLERARTEWLRGLGFEQNVLAQQCGILFAVRWMELDYLLPAHFNEQLWVRSHITELRGASLMLSQTIHRMNDDVLLLTARVRLACLNAATHRPSPLPKPVFIAMKADAPFQCAGKEHDTGDV